MRTVTSPAARYQVGRTDVCESEISERSKRIFVRSLSRLCSLHPGQVGPP